MARTSTRRQRQDERKVRIARNRFARRQRARRWLAWRALLALLLILALLAGTVWLVFFSSVLAVKGVEVQGLRLLRPAQVRRVADVPLGRPLASVDVRAIEARVEKLAPVKAVDVSRVWPHRVRISVLERTAVAVVETGGVVRGIDDEGVMFRTYHSVPKRLPVVRVSSSTHADALAEAARVVDALPRSLAARVDHVAVQTVDSISLELKNGRTVVWGSASESASKARVLAVLLGQQASVYDVSVPGRPAVKR